MIEFLGSRFDQARTFVARPTPEAKDARERTQICTASFPLKNDLLLRNEEGVWKWCRTFAPQNIWLNVRRRGNPRSISVEHSAKLPRSGQGLFLARSSRHDAIMSLL